MIREFRDPFLEKRGGSQEELLFPWASKGRKGQNAPSGENKINVTPCHNQWYGNQ